jgi:hypothetical protein
MEVRLQYVLNFRIVGLRSFKVRLYFAQWINNDSFAIALDVISGFCQATRIDLFNLHKNKNFAVRKKSK